MNSYQLNYIDETTFGLTKSQSVGKEQMNNSSDESNIEINSKRKLSAIKSMFEFNYEVKFTNKDTK